MIPEDLPPMQARTPQELVPLDAALPFPATAPGPAPGEGEPGDVARVFPHGPERCPTCGRPYAPFSLRASGVLDTLHLAQDVLRDALALVEAEVLP